jgi:hypothetical protein
VPIEVHRARQIASERHGDELLERRADDFVVVVVVDLDGLTHVHRVACAGRHRRRQRALDVAQSVRVLLDAAAIVGAQLPD